MRKALHPSLKENLLWVRTFGTIDELCQALLEFREAYNSTWLMERHGFRSAQRRSAGPAFNRGSRRPGCNQVSHQPWVVQLRMSSVPSRMWWEIGVA